MQSKNLSLTILLGDVKNFVSSNNLLYVVNSCYLSKGNCDTIAKKLYNYLLNIGYNDNDLQEIDLHNPKFETNEAHPEWKKYDKKYLVHTVLKVGNFFVDLTGAQYSRLQSGIKIYTLNELGKLWTNYKIMKKDNEGKYIGGTYWNAKFRKF
jgi:hypothetical protein